MTPPLMLQHLDGKPIGRFPVWMMRQAGRFLPSYRAVRAEHSFWEMVTTPALAAEVSLQPVRELDVDACIFFSDILTLPYGLGIPITMEESVGPVVTKPLRHERDFTVFRDFTPTKHTAFVGEALKKIRAELPPEKTLIGFAGAPWTVGCYLVEGRGKSGFSTIGRWVSEDPIAVSEALRDLGGATLSYLKAQVDAGAQIVQLFDTWLAEMPPTFFAQHYLPLLNEIFGSLREKGVKVIYFSKGLSAYLNFAGRLTCDALSIDSSLDLSEVDRTTGGNFSLQGNLDPELLFKSEGEVRQATRVLVQKARTLRKPAIINLGHGVLPKTPVENVKAFIQEAKQLWV